ncbi:MAG: energy transducer TonB [Acidobacteria bacterium]|nr:energy transducer TonB [Acidobacteriota bacterium]
MVDKILKRDYHVTRDSPGRRLVELKKGEIMNHIFVACGLISLLAFAVRSQTCDIQPVKLVMPPYPAVSLALKESGEVIVRVTIDKEGNVSGSKAIEGPKWLRKSSEEVAKAWKFSAVKKSEMPWCNARSADLTFNYVTLPAGTTRGPETQSYFLLPFHVTIKETLGLVMINPTGSPRAWSDTNSKLRYFSQRKN